MPGDSNKYGVTIDSEGNFSGWAWGENIGWINFESGEAWGARVCVVKFDDLKHFAADWLEIGKVSGNLDGQGDVDMWDYSIFASHWQGYCPDGWQLK